MGTDCTHVIWCFNICGATLYTRKIRVFVPIEKTERERDNEIMKQKRASH